MQETELYYIQHKGFVGNCLLWWCVNGGGYTCNLDKAWKVNLAQAKEICASRPTQDIPRKVSEIDAIAERHAG